MDRLLNILAIFSVALIVQVLISVRRAHIWVEYSVSWLTAALLLLIISLNRRLPHWLAEHLGIDDPPVAVLIVIFGIFLVVFYRLSLRVSSLKDANIALAQRVAILEYYLQSRNEESQKGKNG